AVPKLSGDEFLKERMLRATGDGNVATIGERNHAEGILKALLGGYVPGNNSDGANVKLGRIEREHERHGVVGAGVGIENDFLCGGGSGSRENTKQNRYE